MARRFRFRLKTVRKIRQRARDAQRRVVSAKVQAVHRVESRMAQWTRRRHDEAEQRRSVQHTRRLDMVSLCRHQLYRGWLDRNVARSGTELTERRAELAAEQARLAEASKRLQVIEKLRERQWSRFRAEVAREEQRESDEAGLQMYLRQSERREHGAPR